MENKVMYPELRIYIQQLFGEFEEQITDSIFCFIQADRQRMNRYLDVVASVGDVQEVNKQIGRSVASRYGLRGFVDEKNPQSTLIQTYSRLEKNDTE